jgi:VIT1/CCC1 family predicted Fe2+/Mn2+ transporter
MVSSETSPLLPAEPDIERPRSSSSSGGAGSTRRGTSPGSDTKTMTSSVFEDESPRLVDPSDMLRDVIIGFSDGVTVPFALTAGLSSLGSAKLVIMGGLAELFSGMISMGLGAYLAAVTERDHYRSREDEARRDAKCGADLQRADLAGVLSRYGVSREASASLLDELCADRERWVRFMMDFGNRLDRPSVHGAWLSAVTMGLSYFVGGLIPMIPYFVMARVGDALIVSVGVTVAVLLAFGYVKDYVAIRNHRAGAWGALQTLVIGMLAAGTSYLIVRALDAKS